MPGINMNAAVPGISRLAQAMGGGPTGAYQKAYDNQLGLQSRLAQAMAAIEASGATADLNRAKTDSERAEQAMRTPEAIRRTAMTANGIPLDEADSVDSFLKTGHLAGKYDLDPAQQGPTMPAPDWASKLGEVARAMAGSQRALTIGDKSSENIAKAGAIERGERLSDSVINGTANRNTVAGAQAAAAGKDLFSTDATGSVLDRFTGNLATDNPMAGSTINLRKEQAGAQRANAAQSYASAESSRATAAKTREEMQRGARSGDIIQVQQPDGTVLLVNKVTGLSRPAVGMDGKPVVGTAGGKGGAGGKPPAEIQRMAVAMDALDEAMNSYEQELKTFNPRGSDQLDPTQRARLKALMADIQMQYKEAQALGALTGPDLQILDKALTDPATMKGVFYGTGGLTEQLGQARAAVRRRRQALGKQYPGNPAFGGGAQNQADPLGLFTQPVR